MSISYHFNAILLQQRPKEDFVISLLAYQIISCFVALCYFVLECSTLFPLGFLLEFITLFPLGFLLECISYFLFSCCAFITLLEVISSSATLHYFLHEYSTLFPSLPLYFNAVRYFRLGCSTLFAH